MISILENTLLMDDRAEGKIRQTLFSLLLEGSYLAKVRLLSRILRDLVDQRKSRMFSNLYFCMPRGRLDLQHSIPALRRIAIHCTTLTMKVTYGDANSPHTMGEAVAEDELRVQQLEERRKEFEKLHPPPGLARGIWKARNTFREDPPSDSIAARMRRIVPESLEARNLDVVLLQQILQPMHQLATLVIRANADPGWPGFTQTEEILITIRLALERSSLASLRCVCLDPVHAAGILHLRWAAFGAFREQSISNIDLGSSPRQRTGVEMWKNLATLDLRIRNPAATERPSAKQMILFFQVLDDYLRSFSRTLRWLSFVWLDAPGPHPLVFVDLLERKPYVWHKLQELRYGNVNMPGKSLELLVQRMPNLERLKSLVVRARTDCQAEDEWTAIEIPRLHTSDYELATTSTMGRLSQLSLVPPPLFPRRDPAVAEFAARMRASSSVYSRSIDLDGEQFPMSNVNVNAIDTDSDTTVIMPEAITVQEEQHSTLQIAQHTSTRSCSPSGSSESGIAVPRATMGAVVRGMPAYHSTPEVRAPIASSVYSRDENGNYIPVRQRWNRAAHEPQMPSVLVEAPDFSALPRASVSGKPGPTTYVLPKLGEQIQVKLENRRIGREPPAVLPSNLITRKNHIDLGDTQGYKTARDEYMRKISQGGQASDTANEANTSYLALENAYISPRDRIRNWAHTVRSGRPPSTMTVRSTNTFKTTGSRPLSKFFANLRETGRPPRR